MAVWQTAKPLSWLSGSKTRSAKDSVFQKLWPLSICVLTTFVAFGCDLALGEFATEATDALYIMAAATGAYVGGWRYGMLSLGLSLLPNIWLFHFRYYSLSIGAYGWERIFVVTVIGGALAGVVARLHQEQLALRILNEELDARVRSRTADLEESNRQLEAFCYTLAHDLRAPLRAIEGFSHIASETDEPLPADTKAAINRVGRSASAMGRLIHDLLMYTQLHREEIPISKINIDEVVERVLQIVEPEIRQKHASIKVETRALTVTANFALVEQIALSLVSNALRFTHPDIPAQVKISSERHNGNVRLMIEDNGIGIAAEHRDRIFRPFHRLNPSETPDGTGMGLALAKKGVEKLGGQIGVDSQPNVGSRFWIELPE